MLPTLLYQSYKENLRHAQVQFVSILHQFKKCLPQNLDEVYIISVDSSLDYMKEQPIFFVVVIFNHYLGNFRCDFQTQLNAERNMKLSTHLKLQYSHLFELAYSLEFHIKYVSI